MALKSPRHNVACLLPIATTMFVLSSPSDVIILGWTPRPQRTTQVFPCPASGRLELVICHSLRNIDSWLISSLLIWPLEGLSELSILEKCIKCVAIVASSTETFLYSNHREVLIFYFYLGMALLPAFHPPNLPMNLSLSLLRWGRVCLTFAAMCT